MTHPRPTTRPGWWRFLLAALAALVVGLLGVGTASATTPTTAETRVGASTPVAAYVVGVHESVSAGQRWDKAPPQAETASATGVAAKTGTGVVDDVVETAARACSFSGPTVVLMADGTKKPIEDVKVGDKVLATDPETGEQAAKSVEQVFVHEDTLADLVVDGQVITTTDNHPFWSVTDQSFERADQLAPGERVLSADGRALTVSVFKLQTAHPGKAYNLAIEGIHTYHVGQDDILVHNDCGLLLSRTQGARMTTPQATELADWLGYTRVKGATSHGQAVYTNGKNFISADVDAHSRGVWKMASSVDGFGPNQRLGTYDFLLQRFAK